MAAKKISVYDTTLRDGSQSARINYSLEDKLTIAKKLDELGVDYIEGGWPMKGVNNKDFEFFKKAKKLELKHAKLTAFGSTRRAKNKVQDDATLNSLLEAGTKVITIFGKTWSLHAEKILGISLEENLKVIYESVAYLKEKKKEVIFDAEHFFDGYKDNPEYAIKCLLAAQNAGADCLCLCETNGGALPHEIELITKAVVDSVKIKVGIHTHNDCELAAANSIMAVKSGAVQVQGTMNGFGERAGNANLMSIIPILSLKMGYETIPARNLKKLTETSHFLFEVANIPPDDRQPFTGKNAFAHKAGVHANAVLKEASAYEHMNPELVGNTRQILISDQAGASSLMFKAKQWGIDLPKDDPRTKDFIVQIKKMEEEGYEFKDADASLEMFLKKSMLKHHKFFELEGLKVIVEDKSGVMVSEATVKLKVKGQIEHTVADAIGPVGALDSALRKALIKFYPKIKDMHLVDFKVRVLEGSAGTSAKVRVLIESSDKNDVWTTVGVSENIIEASWLALVDSVEYKLLKK
ncbi:MAG: citramalate synthase [Candidatus Goldiibacteriota bacterium HGW-Goldbacteria-1]|jgi:2-isopropylmalate synthase|nr:MAG: citramalate synthase [Candidatus Goldiibacteriota bacterium HGW-Goldbacteria-1]